MTWLSWFFFESLLALGAALFVVDFILLVLWRRTGRPRPLLIGLTLSLVLLAVQGFVVTRREHAAHLLATIEKDVLTACTTGLAAALADDFQSRTMNKQAFLALVNGTYERVHVNTLHRSQLEMRRSQPDQFVVEAAYQADVRADAGSSWVRSRWELTFKQTPAGWRIGDIRALYIDGVDSTNLRSLNLP